MKTIIITGAGRGIGRATALAFLDAGWAVGLIGRDVPALADLRRGRRYSERRGGERSVWYPCE